MALHGRSPKFAQPLPLVTLSLTLCFALAACGRQEETVNDLGNPLNTVLPNLDPIKVTDKLQGSTKASVERFILNDAFQAKPIAKYAKLTQELPYGFTWKNEGVLNLNSADRIQNFILNYNGIPVLHGQLKTYSENGSVDWANASYPSLFSNSATASTNFSLTSDQAAESAAGELHFHIFRFKNPKQIYIPLSGELRAAYEFTVSAAADEPGRGPGFPLLVRVDADSGLVLDENPIAFHVDGTAKMYNENKIASASEGMVHTKLPNLLNDGSALETNQFKVVNCQVGIPSSRCTSLATGTSGDYTSIGYDSQEYDELVAFHSLARAVEWHQKMVQYGNETIESQAGAGWGDTRASLGLTSSNRIKVYVRAETKDPNGNLILDNAQYLPSGLTGTTSPEIVIGTGWESDQGEQRTLQYIGKDGDVSLHEFGHHVVYRSIKETANDSGAMHEGFADYFAYAITGNNKLAETIVRGDSPLRQGNLTGSIADYINKSAHKAGEFWSSALWEMRVNLGEWKDGVAVADRIIWDSIDFLSSDADYYEAIAAIAKSADIFAKKYGKDPVALKETIYKSFSSRSFIDASSGNGELPAKSRYLTSSSATENTSASQNATSSQSGGGGFCGVVSDPKAGKQSSFWWLALSAMLPCFLYRRRPSTR